MAKCDEDYSELAERFQAAMSRGKLRVLTPRNSAWMSRTGLAWWIGYAIHEPSEFAYVAPRRIACHLGRHNPTCVGRAAPHPRRW